MANIKRVKTLFGMSPMAFNILCVRASYRINEGQRVDDSVVLVTQRLDLTIRRPLIRQDGGTRQNMVLDDWQKGGSVTGINTVEERLLVLSANPAEDPLLLKHAPPIVLSSDEQALVDLNCSSRSTYPRGVGKQNFGTDFSAVIVVIDYCLFLKLQLFF